MILDMRVENGTTYARIDIPECGYNTAAEGSGENLRDALKHLHAQLECPEREDDRLVVGDERMDMLEMLVKEQKKFSWKVDK